MNKIIVCLGLFLFLVTGCEQNKKSAGLEMSDITPLSQVERGRYLIVTGGCNDCHTEGFMQNPVIPENVWLTGSSLGWQGPWGTTYPPNLRLTVQNLSEEAWIKMLKTRKGMPPMPWPSVNGLNESDSKAMYAYIKSLGARGERAPLAIAPGITPTTPYLSMVPQNLPVKSGSQ